MKRALLLFAGLAAFVALLGLAGRAAWLPQRQEALAEMRIYAYRDWQSVGIRVAPGDFVTVEAEGRWLYTPGEYHGPEGHARYPAPSFYPVPYGPGGRLLARVGNGVPLPVGKNGGFSVDRGGLLYFRINDDKLTDNDGSVTVKVWVMPETR